MNALVRRLVVLGLAFVFIALGLWLFTSREVYSSGRGGIVLILGIILAVTAFTTRASRERL